jgi:hypothetical protein
MASKVQNVFSVADLNYLTSLPEVLATKEALDAGVPKVSFHVTPTTGIVEALNAHFGLQVSGLIPMRWIVGDTPQHADRGPSPFQHTYLVYLNDSPGHLTVGDDSVPIEANTGVVFQEGLRHETVGTESVPRLLVGPMNELVESVGESPIHYYLNEYDATNGFNPIGYSDIHTVGSSPLSSAYTSWRIAPNLTSGSSPSNVVYPNGSVLEPDGSYYMYPNIPCFLEGTTILCQVDGVDKYVAVEHLKPGSIVKTALDGYKPVVLIGKGPMQNSGTSERTENRLYKCSPSKYPELTHDLFLTGCHSILEFPITEQQKEAAMKHMGKMYVTDNKYRLMACVDERAEPWASTGTYTIWHFALEHRDEKMNYGVYANGLLVETTSIHFLKHKSNMMLV